VQHGTRTGSEWHITLLLLCQLPLPPWLAAAAAAATAAAAAADPERQKECELLLGPISNERFAELVAIGKLISDYVGEGEVLAAGDGEGGGGQGLGGLGQLATRACGLYHWGW